MPGLTVLMDHVAGLRDLMHSAGPDPAAAAVLAELAGADGIGISLKQEHVSQLDRDVRLLRQTVHCRLLLYMAPSSEMVGLALEIKPERVVLIPQVGLEGPMGPGLDLDTDAKDLFETVDTLKVKNIGVSICISPSPRQAKAACQIGASWVLLHTGGLQSAGTVSAQTREMDNLVDTIKMANKLRLHTAVGHGLDYHLIKLFKGITHIDEFSIGRSVIARSLMVGMERAVREMKQAIRDLALP